MQAVKEKIDSPNSGTRLERIKEAVKEKIKGPGGDKSVLGKNDSGFIEIRLVRSSTSNDGQSDPQLTEPTHENFEASCLEPGRSSYYGTCGYDPYKTVERIENLLTIPCVESVYVPNRFLVNKFSNDGRVLYNYFETKNRFELRVKDHCKPTQSPEQETPPRPQNTEVQQ